MVLLGFSLAKAIYHNSFMGIILALIAFGVSIYFLYVLVNAKKWKLKKTLNYFLKQPLFLFSIAQVKFSPPQIFYSLFCY